ncbi:MAG TPA: hypothetical protein VMF53_11995 [Alphaproteobacteria bacterium]|nr:hypothetical protein [Alphaproteobacteria bacterium]
MSMLGLIGAGSIALACGPDFPWQLLDNRKATLSATPINSFAFEAIHLLPEPSDALHPRESPFAGMSTWRPNMLANAENVGLNRDQILQLSSMRNAQNGDRAFEMGARLPAAVRLYTAGAVDYHHNELARALMRFNAILKLPESERELRAVWAAYMIGRISARAGQAAQAYDAFALTRALARAGASDPLGLAVASFGEEARVHLERAEALLDGTTLAPTRRSQFGGEVAAAVELYAEQAARRSGSGTASLRMVAARLLHSSTQLGAVVGDPLVQRLLVAYVQANGSDSVHWALESSTGRYNPPKPDRDSVVLIDAIVAAGIDHPADADRLAAMAYRIGRYDLARAMVAKASGPLASWIAAKLALQKGDVMEAAADYAAASRAFPPSDGGTTLDAHNVRLLVGESGVLALARGDYLEALERLYPVAESYWGDVAYLAERVLTTDELKHFVDAHVPAPGELAQKPLPSFVAPRRDGGGISYYRSLSYYGYYRPPNAAVRLRDLLARRLVRDGRFAEALPYFHYGRSSAFPDAAVRDHVAFYALALRGATTEFWAVDRAREWYIAAVLARISGMDMMGFEGPPDYFANEGNFDFGYGQEKLGADDVTHDERVRFAASAAHPDLRFHYRYIAVEHAMRAADLLPPRSQAFAAVLCKATGWMIESMRQKSYDAGWVRLPPRPPDRAKELVQIIYRRYVAEGPYEPWAAHFGRRCPEPDFIAAAHFARIQPFIVVRSFVSLHRWWWAAGLVGLALIMALFWAGKRKRSNAV